MIIAGYKCACSWIGSELDKPQRCLIHNENIDKKLYIGSDIKIETGWLFVGQP